ncbi:MAG: hypothetical protein HFE63_03575 [Clostridiales bacterium]|nr:hypothetical protein [Clostridiales bacterium]
MDKIKKLISCFNTGIFILLGIGIMLVCMNFADTICSFKPAISFDDLLDENTKVKAGSHVAGNVEYVIDYFATESTYTQYKDGSRSTSKANGRYYLIPTYDGYIGMKCRQVDVSSLEKICDETWDYLDGGALPTTEYFMEGRVKKMESDIKKYYNEYLIDMGYTTFELEQMGEPLLIDYTSFTAVRVMFLIGVVLIALGVLFLVKSWKRLTLAEINAAKAMSNGAGLATMTAEPTSNVAETSESADENESPAEAPSESEENTVQH